MTDPIPSEEEAAPLIVTRLPEGATVATSGVAVAGRDAVCLVLVLLLLLYSVYTCFVQWKKNYQLIDGDFSVFEGEPIYIIVTIFQLFQHMTDWTTLLSYLFSYVIMVCEADESQTIDRMV